MTIRLRALKRLAPIEVPKAFDFTHLKHIDAAETSDFTRLTYFQPADVSNFSGLVMSQAATEVVRFAPLEQPAQDSIPTLQKPSALKIELLGPIATTTIDATLDDLHFSDSTTVSDALDDGLYIPNTEIASDVHIDSLFVPDNISLFEPLSRPRALGKDYRTDETDANKRSAIQPKLVDSVAECPHGVVRSQCAMCLANQRSASQRKDEPKTEVVDVFEQLRYILQPPILPIADQPVIPFPNGQKPYEFQIAGVNWLVEHKQGLLADEMGLGKTIQAIIAMRVLFRRGELQRALVVCPASMTNVWEREVKSWAPELRPLRVQGDTWRREAMWESHAETYIVSYETLRNDIEHIPPDRFDLYVLDEAQKIKIRALKRIARLSI